MQDATPFDLLIRKPELSPDIICLRDVFGCLELAAAIVIDGDK